MHTNVLGIRIPKLSKQDLVKKIDKLSSNAKTTLVFFYSEFFLRANRNPFYKEAVIKADIVAVDGRGAIWAGRSLSEFNLFSTVYFWCYSKIGRLRVLLFLVLFFCNLIWNFIDGWLFALLKKERLGDAEVILGRNFVYDLLQISQGKNWTVAVVGGGDSEEKLKDAILKKYPNLRLNCYLLGSNSVTMQDKIFVEGEFRQANHTSLSGDLNSYFPELSELEAKLAKQKHDLILVTLGGQSGKQELFLQQIKENPEIQFRLATGIGAALDHFGAGNKQKPAPLWLQKLSLEWLYRLIFLPYRRTRVLDSILSFYWWVSLQQFTKKLKYRKTVSAVVTDEKKYLIGRRRAVLPGDLGWIFAQGGIEKPYPKKLENLTEKELKHVQEQGLKELWEETGHNFNLQAEFGETFYCGKFDYPISFLRFTYLGCLYRGAEIVGLPIKISGDLEKIEFKTGLELAEIQVAEKEKVAKLLAPDKLKIWLEYEANRPVHHQ